MITNTEMPHIGNILAKYAKEKRIYKSAWGRAQGVKKQTITSWFKKENMQVHTLIKISYVLNHNFIMDIAHTLPPDMPHTPNSTDTVIASLQKENEELKKEVEILRGVVGVK